MMRSLLVAAGHTAARVDGELRQDYLRLKLRRSSGVAKVAIARKLAIRMYWMLRGPARCPDRSLYSVEGSCNALLNIGPPLLSPPANCDLKFRSQF